MTFPLPLLDTADGLRELLPEAASAAATNSEPLFLALLAFAAAVLAALVVAVDLLLLRHLRRSEEEIGTPTAPSRGLVVTLVLLPLLVAGLFFQWGLNGFLDLTVPPVGSYDIRVEASENGWSFGYDADFSTAELHLPVEQPVRLILRSTDVVHGLSIPAFRLSAAVLPDRETQAWVQATEPGRYRLGSTAPSAAEPESLLTEVVVHPVGEFDRWLAESASVVDRLPPVEAGQVLVQRNGCLACHSLDGTPGTAPTFLGVVGRRQSFTDGSTLVADEAYLAESILQSQARVVAGFPPVMPDFSSKLDEREVAAIIEYLKTLTVASEEQ